MKGNRTYSQELKTEAIKMVLEQGLSREETAKRLMIPKGTIGNWISAAKTGKEYTVPGEQSNAALIAENARLKKDLADARMEREILKKATAYFARESLPGMRS